MNELKHLRLVPLLILMLAAPAFGQVIRDRILSRIRTSVAPSETGRLSVSAFVDLATTESSTQNLSFRVITSVQRVGTVGFVQVALNDVGVFISTDPGCTSASPATGCSGGTCANVTVGAVTYAGTCQVHSIPNPGGYPTIVCLCYFSAIKVEAGDEIEAQPGDRIRVELIPSPVLGGADETPGHAGNESLTVHVGSFADHPDAATPGRSPTPLGGQRNTPSASLLITGLTAQGLGPLEGYGQPGSQVQSSQGACGANIPITLAVGIAKTSAVTTPIASLDLEPGSLLFIYDGIGFAGPGDGTKTGPGGTLDAPFAMPNLPAGVILSAQGVSLDPTCPQMFALTARYDLGSQDVQSLPPPQIPPFGASGGVPFAAPRPGVIVPNHGPVATGPGRLDGTLHSVMGRNFDAVHPGNNSVRMNGIQVDVLVVRPTEILFQLLPPHRAGIAGPLVIFSTGGTSSGSPDQMESWVFATPPTNRMAREPANVIWPVPSGGFLNNTGLQGAQARITNGIPDRWGFLQLGSGRTVKALACELDPVTNQLVSGCSPYSPLSLCFPLSTHPLAQLPTSPHLRTDFVLTHRSGIFPFPIQRSQYDGGPGFAPFAGMSGIPGPATTTSVDPDGALVTVTNSDILEVWAPTGTGTAAPQYLLLVAF